MTQTLRLFSVAGPCLTHVRGAGPIIRETKGYWFTREPYTGEEQKVSKRRDGAHVEPCRSCCDHPQTMYPHGYMD